jgi:hypothetical protein
MSCLQIYRKKIRKFRDYPFCRISGIRNITVVHAAVLIFDISTHYYTQKANMQRNGQQQAISTSDQSQLRYKRYQ